ncbi:MAG: universal stress protein [Desulfobacterales bacterium]|jgi:hypothetical protein|nr:universal stress protein [Desulfobacterales bacterium]
MGIQKLLLPYNFSVRDCNALEFTASTFAPRGDIEITLFHAYLLLSEIQVQDRQVTDRLKHGRDSLRAKIKELESDLEKVRDDLIDRGFAPAQVRTVLRPRRKEVLDAILDLHRRERFDFIVLSRRPGRISRFFSGSLHTKLLSVLTNVTICVVS